MTSITRLDPFRGLSSWQDHMNRLFEDAFFRGRGENSSLTTWAPPVDILETPEELVVTADLPGMNEKDLDIRVENNTLTIHGERNFAQTVSEDHYLRSERVYGSFHRSFGLPATVNPDGIKADYRHGVLTVRVPKREESKPRQIRVAVSPNGK